MEKTPHSVWPRMSHSTKPMETITSTAWGLQSRNQMERLQLPSTSLKLEWATRMRTLQGAGYTVKITSSIIAINIKNWHLITSGLSLGIIPHIFIYCYSKIYQAHSINPHKLSAILHHCISLWSCHVQKYLNLKWLMCPQGHPHQPGPIKYPILSWHFPMVLNAMAKNI